MFARRKLWLGIFVARRRHLIGFNLEAIETQRRIFVLGRGQAWWNFNWNGGNDAFPWDRWRDWWRNTRRTNFRRRWPVIGITWTAATVLSLALNQKLHTSLDQLRTCLKREIFPLIFVSDLLPTLKLNSHFTRNNKRKWVLHFYFFHFGFVKENRKRNSAHNQTQWMALHTSTVCDF